MDERSRAAPVTPHVRGGWRRADRRGDGGSSFRADQPGPAQGLSRPRAGPRARGAGRGRGLAAGHVRSEAARRSLEAKGVEVLLKAKVEGVTASSIRLSDGHEILASTVIWTAGVRASDLGTSAALPLGRQARVQVMPTLQAPGHSAGCVI